MDVGAFHNAWSSPSVNACQRGFSGWPPISGEPLARALEANPMAAT
ncbi:hypothetical protein BamMEX5DRAFT_5136 [Burkholderia ambifaria MEX-5]|uniref:Uncharacterized protein n=2 Tax=Burkholderia ambifaria TaxID=152480 RepID=B1TBH0_9BURK|nr:hypothetical protein BamMEX5DRAFT_5136 [Burkholderia ambifaria MEX-5]